MRTIDMKRAYEDLANAIVLQAIDDYVHVRKVNHTSLYAESGINNREEIRKFVYSDWFALLTDVKPDVVMNEMYKRRYEYANGIYQRRTPKCGVDD